MEISYLLKSAVVSLLLKRANKWRQIPILTPDTRPTTSDAQIGHGKTSGITKCIVMSTYLNADIDILKDLINGRSHRLEQLDDTPIDHYTTVLSKKPYVAKCAYIHQRGSDVVEGRMN